MRIVLILFSCLIGTFVFAEDASLDLAKRLHNLKTFKANFNQEVSVQSKSLSKTRGILYLMRPGRFMWDTKAPLKQKIIADGAKFWIYDLDLDQVTVQKQNSLNRGTIALFLSDTPEIGKFFTVEKVKLEQGIMFKLHSRKIDYSQIKNLDLVFINQILHGILLEDELGQITHIKFSNIKQNIALSAEIFNFVVPKGVDLIRI